MLEGVFGLGRSRQGRRRVLEGFTKGLSPWRVVKKALTGTLDETKRLWKGLSPWRVVEKS